MKMKEPLEKKHYQEPSEHPRRRPIQRMQLFVGVRQEMQQRDAEHQAGHETDGHLQTRVGGMDD